METTADKTAQKTRGFRKGADPRRGHGLPGRSGRKPNSFVEECQRLADEVILPTIAKYVAEHQPTDEGYRWAATKVLEYAKGKPAAVQVNVTQTVNYLLEAPPKTPSPEAWREQFAGRN